MAQALLSVPSKNFIQKTLNAQLLAGATSSFTLNNVTSIQNLPGIAIVDRINTNNAETPEKREVIRYTGVSGNTLTGLTRNVDGSGSDQDHAVGAIVEFVPDVTWAQSMYDGLSQVVVPSTGLLDTTKVADLSTSQTFTNKTITDSGSNVMAKSLKSATTTVDVSAATAPSAGQVLTATSSSAATWQSPASSDGWTSDSSTWTYSSVDGGTGVVTINADLTGNIQVGDRIKFTQTTVKYFIVTKTPTYSSGNTTLTFWGGTDYTLANAAITSPSYSHMKTPFGFNPNPDKWSLTLSDTSQRSQSSPASATWYNLGSASLDIHIGAWRVWYSVMVSIQSAGTFTQTTLSTSNNSESDTGFTAFFGGGRDSNGFLSSQSTREKIVAVTSKTTYYLLSNGNNMGGSGTLYNRGDNVPTIIKAVCAYL